MTAHQANKIMRRYFRTGQKPRYHTFCRAFNCTKIKGCRYVRPFNVGRSIALYEAVYGPPPFDTILPIMRFLDGVYEHLIERMGVPPAMYQPAPQAPAPTPAEKP